MIKNGWIKIHRKLTEWEWYDDQPTFRLWMHLLLTVNWQPKKWHGIEIPAGGRIVTYDKLAEETGLKYKQVRQSLDKLKSTGEVGTKRAGKGQLVTIEKYALYQGEENEKGSLRADKRAEKGQFEGRKRATIKEYKNLRNKESIYHESYGTYNNVTLTQNQHDGLMDDFGPSFSSLINLVSTRIHEGGIEVESFPNYIRAVAKSEGIRTIAEEAERQDRIKQNEIERITREARQGFPVGESDKKYLTEEQIEELNEIAKGVM